MFLSVRNVKKIYRKNVHAVRDVSFDLERGEALGIVGESGCGKSTLARIVMRLLAPDGGEVLFDGDLRGRAQIVFQNPFSSFDPRLTVGASLAEALRVGGLRKKKDIRAGIEEALQAVNLSARIAERFPHEISGGECQRAAIARALSRSPELLVCDEPVSSLDLLAQARVLNLLVKLRKERSIGLLFISHDLRVVRHLCDRVLVMKEGVVCERGELSQVYARPQHPYTRELLFSSGI